MNYFFTSDHHWYHANIIKYTKRPFKDVNEMNEILIQKWNEKIGQNDIIYYLGDFCFGGASNVSKLLNRLNGFVNFIIGSHDKSVTNFFKDMNNGFYKQFNNRCKLLGEQKEIEINDEIIVLNHYAMRRWSRSHYGSWHLFGHSHGRLEPYGFSFDVGVDSHHFYPLSFDEISEKMYNTINCLPYPVYKKNE